MQLHQLPPRRGFALAHQFGDQAFRLGEIVVAQLHRQQAPGVRVEGGFPQLLGVHFTQALKTANAPGVLAHAVLA